MELSSPVWSFSTATGLSGIRIEGIALLVVPPLVKSISHRPLGAVDLRPQSGVPCDQPLLPGLKAIFILYTGRNRSPWVVMRVTPGAGGSQGLKNGVREVIKHVSIAIRMCNCGLNGISDFK